MPPSGNHDGVSERDPVSAPAEPAVGWLAPEVELELPGLTLFFSEVEVRRAGSLTGDSPPDVEARLRGLSNRVRGARAISLRSEPIPAAYRAFFRQVGLDPDLQRTPIEAAVLERMLRGGFLTGGMLDDILLIALLDTGVPVWALDASRVQGPLGIRTSREGERLGRSGDPPLLPEGRLVVADAEGPVAVLFGERAPGHEPRSRTARLVLYAVQVPGVPALYAEEALWASASALLAP
jgi:DNA/RNA-binding domain of Phe-tRNA-synthetase-like protein